MSIVFKCDGAAMKGILEQMEEVQSILQETYSDGSIILGEIQSKTAWTGDAQKTMEAFLDLVVQYHKDLGAGDSTPVAEAVDALEKLQNNLSKFYGGWTEWSDLKKIC